MRRFFGRRRSDRNDGPQRVVDQPLVTGIEPEFRMIVEGVFHISGRGWVVTGMIEAGPVAEGCAVAIERDGRQVGTSEVIGIELHQRLLKQAGAGDHVGLLLRGLRRGHVVAGDVLRSTR